MGDYILKILFTFVYLIYGVLTDIPNDTGYHLAGDRVAAKARRIFQIPHEDRGRDLEVNIAGFLEYGTWQKSNGRMSFPEVSQVYSWAKRSRADGENGEYSNTVTYSMVKNDMGKYSWWTINGGRFNGLLTPGSKRRGVTNTNDQNEATWNRVRARFDSLTGDCTHKMHYQHPYMIIVCYNNDAIHNTLNSPMVYDYYLHINRPAGEGGANLANGIDPDTSWPISGQNYMNSTKYNAGGVDNPDLYSLGHGPVTVDFNHRVHTSSIWANRIGELTQGGGGMQYWTVTWNGPYQGQMSAAARFPTNTWGGAGKTNVPPSEVHSRSRFFMRPHKDMRYLKMCDVLPQIADLAYILDIVQPRPQTGPHTTVYITYMANNFPAATQQHQRVAKCTLLEAAGTTGINQDFRESMPFSTATQNFDEVCFSACVQLNLGYTATAGNVVGTQTFNNIAEGGIKIVPNGDETNTHDYIVMVDTNTPAAGTTHHTGKITRCRIQFTDGAIQNNSCDEDPICPERNGRNAFGYFSDCRDTSSCGIYYMGTVDKFNTHNLMNRVYCADIISFSGNEDPIKYRRHFTAVHAFDVASYIQTTIETESASMSIRSYQDIIMYPNAMIQGQPAIANDANWAVPWLVAGVGANTAKLWDRNPLVTPDALDGVSADIPIIGRVTQAHLPNSIDDNYQMLGYYNHTYALPFRRHHWKINAPQIELTGAEVNQSYLLLGNVHMENTEDWTLFDQIPLGYHSLRVRHQYHGTGLRHLEVVRCTQKFNFTTTLNCTHINANINVNNHGVLLSLDEHISRVWKFDESIVVLTHRPRQVITTAGNNVNTKNSRIMIFNKNTMTWSARTLVWSGYNANQAVLEYIDCVEHEGDIHFAYKWNVYYENSNGVGTGAAAADRRWITTPIRRARAYGLNCNDVTAANAAVNGGYREVSTTIPEYNWRPNHHPTIVGANGVGNLDHGWTNIRFHPLEDDSCITGFNIVQDCSWRIRFLVDCNRRARNSDTMNTRLLQTGVTPTNNEYGQGKWIGDYWMFDNDNVARYRNLWNVTLRNGEGSDTDFLGDDWEEGCATREHVFIFDRRETDDGWVMAAVHMHHHSIRMFELNRWGINGIKNVYCVGDNVVAHLTWFTSATSNGDAIAVLYGTNLGDARRRIHSMEKFPQAVTSVMPTKFGDKIWIRFVMNERPFYRVAWMDGPIVLFNSTRDQLTQSSFIRMTSGSGNVTNTPATVGFIFANNEVNMTNITRQLWAQSSWDLDSLTNITGHVYTVSTYGEHDQLMSFRQRVNKETDNWSLMHGDLSATENRPWSHHAPNDPKDNRRRFYEMRIKGTRMIRLFYDRYYTRMTHYNAPNTVLHGMNTGYETQYLDFAMNPTNNNYYWATVAQETHYKHVRVWKHLDSANFAQPPDGNGIRSLDWSGRIVHNDDIHGLTLDTVTKDIYLMTFYNENDRLLNISTFNFGAFVYQQIPADDNDPTHVDYSLWSSGNYNQDILGPAHTELYCNSKFTIF